MVDAFEFRVMTGRKLRRTDFAPGHDLRLDYWHPTRGEWVPVSMILGAMLADFFYENENAIAPEPYIGGQYYLNHCRTATQVGWRRAAEILQRERATSKQQKGALV